MRHSEEFREFSRKNFVLAFAVDLRTIGCGLRRRNCEVESIFGALDLRVLYDSISFASFRGSRKV